jgi:inosose dehydratase
MRTRRTFLGSLASIPLGSALLAFESADPAPRLPISCNSYDWLTFYWRSGKSWGDNPAADFAELSKTGLQAYEPGVSSREEVRNMIPFLRQHGIQMPSIYVGSVLHREDEAEKSIQEMLAIAEEARPFGLRILVTNPNPIQWGSPILKSEQELILQTQYMEKLGAALREKGITLAYHTHDAEMMAGAREFHHMLQNTSARNVSFCFDVHWVYRGCQNSQIAVFDVLKMYGHRIAELHLRQSAGGVWSETFGEGDIDYRRFAAELARMKIRPHLVIEQCVEDKTPNTLDAVRAHQEDLAQVQDIFKALL